MDFFGVHVVINVVNATLGDAHVVNSAKIGSVNSWKPPGHAAGNLGCDWVCSDQARHHLV